MVRKIVHLEFKSPIHIGSDIAGIGIENVSNFAHSDTLFSCFINAYVALYGIDRCNSLLTKFLENGNPPFKISSSFPFSVKNDEKIYFLPKPLINPPQFFGKDSKKIKNEVGKDLKKTTYISINQFCQWISGNKDFSLKGIKEIFDENKPFINELRPRHAQDRFTNASAIYYVGLTHFKNGGLYFILEIDENKISLEEIEKVWKLAGYHGLGGRRSSGNGIFEPIISNLTDEFKTLFSTIPDENFGYIILSLYYPSEELLPISYNIIPRKGWTFSTVHQKQMKRKICNMFSEGSVFENKPIGTLVDITPDGFPDIHNVYRLGQPIFLPIKLLKSSENEEQLPRD